MPTVRAIVDAAAAEGYRFETIVRGIVASPAFGMRVAPATEATASISPDSNMATTVALATGTE